MEVGESNAGTTLRSLQQTTELRKIEQYAATKSELYRLRQDSDSEREWRAASGD
jgi:hypothetical protein